MKAVIIIASSRKDGNTNNIAKLLAEHTQWVTIDLIDYNISHFDYKHNNVGDDFLPLIEKLITNYDHFIFATPVYWYSMSGILKVFFDRITDLLTIKKELGRKLKGKNMSVITSSTGDNLGDTFWIPFIKTAEYLEMSFCNSLHTTPQNSDKDLLTNFIVETKKTHYKK